MAVRRFWLVAISFGTILLTGNCSSNQDPVRGSFAVRLSARNMDPGAGHERSDDAVSGLLAATVTVSGIEARRSDGTWIAVETGLPANIDIVSLSRTGSTVTLPAELLPEGSCTELQIRLTKVDLALNGGVRRSVHPPAIGWTLILPVDFAISPGRSTTIELRIATELSLRKVGDAYDFEPDVEVAGVRHESEG